MLQVISLAQYATVYTRSWAVDSINERVRLKAETDRLRQEVALQREEARIKDARMAGIAPHRRPHYAPTERTAILELRAARGWSLEIGCQDVSRDQSHRQFLDAAYRRRGPQCARTASPASQ